MFEFNKLEHIQLRKDCELHQIYQLDCNLIVMLINFNTSYYFDVIQLQVSRKLIKINCIPVFAFICGKSSIGLAHYENAKLTIQSFDFLNLNQNISNLLINKPYRDFLTFYFKRTQISMLLFHYECGSIISYFLNNDLEIQNQFYLIYQADNQILQSIYQLNQSDQFISLHYDNNQEYKLFEFQSNGIKKQIESKYLNDQNSFNGCTQTNNQIILVFTPKINTNSFIEFINQQYESVRIVEINYFNYIISIESILFDTEFQVWCKISTQQEVEIEQLCVFDKNNFQLISRKIYPDYMLDIQCTDLIIIETQMNLFDRINCLQKNHQTNSNEIEELKQLEDFDDFSEITIYYNLNPIYQTIKLMKFFEFEEYIIEQTIKKLKKQSSNILKQQDI
ncbi:unnamed protein product [Paramecium sonneborni]|uniref:Uncharacterized protein n=1 Tax=Paramecium sonneborni TaxID=65129 RepID=A0A8S1LQV2_9CILI|nr:unnamed protein product [Paramecium sonneborni]